MHISLILHEVDINHILQIRKLTLHEVKQFSKVLGIC